MLMALMLYITAIKLFHTHPGGYSSQVVHVTHVAALSSIPPHSQGQHIMHGNHCAICDFQLAKDADVATLSIDVAPIRQIDVLSITCLSAGLPAFPVTTPGRAPPATA